MDRRPQQSAVEAAAQRQAEIFEAERRFRADLADPDDFRIHSRRDRVDPRAPQAAGADERRGRPGQAGRAVGGDQPPGRGQPRGDRSGDEVPAQGRRTAPRSPRGLDRGLFQAAADDGRRPAGLASDRQPARQSQRTLSSARSRRGKPRRGQAGARPGRRSGGEPEGERHASAPAARGDDRQGGQGRRGRRQCELDRADLHRHGAGRHRRRASR